MGDYILQCQHPDCRKTYDHDDFRLYCDAESQGLHSPALLRSVYQKSKIRPAPVLPGIFKYIDWLPCGDRYLNINGLPLTYKSAGLAKRLKLEDLWIIFSGFWPARGGELVTRSFKQLEAPATIARYLTTKANPLPLLVSSAGNTANAFNYVTHELGLPLYIVFPLSGLRKLRLPFRTRPFSIAITGDYGDAIDLADKLAEKTGLFREGGVRNIARRDGMGVAMLEAVTLSGYLFDHYFQAVGSGSGAIAAWEAVLRLIKDGRYGTQKTKLHLAQNKPFTPLVDSWQQGMRRLIDIPEADARERIDQVIAEVLTNRHPPYEIHGGVRDALLDTDGVMYGISNADIFDAARIFRAYEGIDIGPAAAAATAALMQAVETGRVQSNNRILLHITGGGFEAELSRYGDKLYEFSPTIVVNADEVDKVAAAIGEVPPIRMRMDILKKFDNLT